MYTFSKYFLSVIHNSNLLAQIFIVILFAENFNILFNNESILNLNFSFNNMPVKPFILFVIFIFLSRIIWVILDYFMELFFNINSNKNNIRINKKVAFNSFLLFSLCIIFLIIYSNQIGTRKIWFNNLEIIS